MGKTRSKLSWIAAGLIAGALGALVVIRLHEPASTRVGQLPPRLIGRVGALVASIDETLRSQTVGSDEASLGSDASPFELSEEPRSAQFEREQTEQRQHLYTLLLEQLELSSEQLARVRAIVEASDWMGTGSPSATEHPLSRAECQRRRKLRPLVESDTALCGAPHMVTVFTPDQGVENARLCMDQFEFPNVPCEYPIAWVRADEAAALCRVLDKRLCDAHEWEGACAGELWPAERGYDFDLTRLTSNLFRNQHREIEYAPGHRPAPGECATSAKKSPGCLVPTFGGCGTNSYPSGSFPDCVSPYGVYDLHGNLAEHMSFPTAPSELGSRGGSGETEMKGSWFGFDVYQPHEDDCRFRAPPWHLTRVLDPNSHRNYHLGFRCCRDLD